MPVSDVISGIAGTAGSAVVGGLAGQAMDKWFGKDPVDESERMMDRLFPGTTPFERLSGGAASVSNSGVSSENSKRQQIQQQSAAQMQASTAKYVADKNAETERYKADMEYGKTDSPWMTKKSENMDAETALQKTQAELNITSEKAKRLWAAMGENVEALNWLVQLIPKMGGEEINDAVNDIIKNGFKEYMKGQYPQKLYFDWKERQKHMSVEKPLERKNTGREKNGRTR